MYRILFILIILISCKSNAQDNIAFSDSNKVWTGFFHIKSIKETPNFKEELIFQLKKNLYPLLYLNPNKFTYFYKRDLDYSDHQIYQGLFRYNQYTVYIHSSGRKIIKPWNSGIGRGYINRRINIRF